MDKNNSKSPNAEREEKILGFWDEKAIFEKTLKKEAPKGEKLREFIFYEGPPTANGKPGIHHLEARAFKDAIPRYKTMQGFYVRRKGGWDTHGLPVELSVEKALGLTSKKDIEKYGVAEFNKKCKESVFTYLEDWGKFTKRMGYWVDQENAYYTFNNSYIEALWGVVKKIDEKDLLYKDYKVVPWCPRCGTALSSHELAQGYETTKDLAVFVKFKILNLKFKDTYIVAWTTTPWTLPGNVALAVGEKIDYVKVKKENEFLIVAKERLSVLGEGFAVVEEIKGKDLVGLEYEPLYPFLKDSINANGENSEKEKLQNAFKIYTADFVTTTDGTGVVHTAVMYGQDDFALGTKVNLPKYHLVKEDGHFKDETGFLSGLFVKDEATAVEVIKDLAHRTPSLLFKKEKYEHSYPHCWRCKTPLIYFARDSWYIRVSSIRDTLVAENQKINWEPEYIKDGRFGEWLKDVKDWAISRERYWGTPLPLWLSEDGKEKLVVDSLQTLKKHVKKSGNKYFLVRHGEAEHNALGILSSDLEKYPLTEKGKEEILSTSKDLKNEKIDLIISSPVLRAKESAEILAKELGVPIEIDARIREEDFGVLSGNPWSEFAKIYPTFTDRIYKKYENVETLIETRKRLGEFIYEIEKKYSNKNIVILTHDGPAKLLLCLNEGMEHKKIEPVYKPGQNVILTGGFLEFPFVPIPHNEEYELDFHKPYIDAIELFSDKGVLLKRTKEVMDVWFDSGAMPFAEDHCLGGSIERENYPADFISEAIDQTRGWFYTLHAVGNLLGKGRAYKNVICLGHLNDKDGKKMSKSLGNIIDPNLMIEKYGVDALRLWMYGVNQPGEPKSFDEKTVDEIVKKVFNLLSNVTTFYELYRDTSLETNDSPKSENVLDQWIIAKLNILIEESTSNLEKYKLLEPVRAIREFTDDLSTWYVRRSRDRLRDGDKEAKVTLYFVLKTVSKLLAPFAPFFAEDLYQKLRLDSDVESVHLENWPKGESVSKDVIEQMKIVRNISSVALKLRSDAKINVRQPLKEIKVKDLNLKDEYLEIIKDEVNVKNVVKAEKIESEVFLDTEITSELKEEGVLREFIRSLQELRKTEGYDARDRAELVISSDDAFKNIVSKYESDLMKVVGLDKVSFGTEAEKEITIDTFSLKVKISKK